MNWLKVLIVALIGLSASSSFAGYVNDSAKEKTAVYLKAFEIFHPELNIKVSQPVSNQSEALKELKRLDAILNQGAPYNEGEIKIYSCSNPACGGSGDCVSCF